MTATLAQILASLSRAKGRIVRSAEYPSLSALLDDWRRTTGGTV